MGVDDFEVGDRTVEAPPTGFFGSSTFDREFDVLCGDWCTVGEFCIAQLEFKRQTIIGNCPAFGKTWFKLFLNLPNSL